MCVGTGIAALAQPALARPAVLSPVDFSACANQSVALGGPVGASAGNAQTPDSALTFTLLDPTEGNNAWVGSNGGSIMIKLSVASPKAIYMLMNSVYGQGGVANATVTVFGSSRISRQNLRLSGNKTIRDYNNWVWTNTINGTSTQEWWTNNPSPQP